MVFWALTQPDHLFIVFFSSPLFHTLHLLMLSFFFPLVHHNLLFLGFFSSSCPTHSICASIVCLFLLFITISYSIYFFSSLIPHSICSSTVCLFLLLITLSALLFCLCLFLLLFITQSALPLSFFTSCSSVHVLFCVLSFPPVPHHSICLLYFFVFFSFYSSLSLLFYYPSVFFLMFHTV